MQEPIGLAGGNPTLYGYVGDVNMLVDEFGLDSNYGFRGDDSYKGGDEGLPLGSSADITDPYSHVTRPGKGETSIYTSFSETRKGASKFTKGNNISKVSMEDLKQLEAEGKIKIYDADAVKEMLGGKKGKNAAKIMKNNGEFLVEGSIP